MNYHKLNGLKQCRFIVLQIWISEVQNGSAGVCFFWSNRRKSFSLLLPASRGCLYSLAKPTSPSSKPAAEYLQISLPVPPFFSSFFPLSIHCHLSPILTSAPVITLTSLTVNLLFLSYKDLCPG